jgi:F-type H+-transporting ATPase subunit c
MDVEVVKMLAVAIIGSLGLAGPAMAIGLIGFSAMGGIARNPEAKQAIMTNMILSTAFAEAIGIYALIIAVILAMIL